MTIFARRVLLSALAPVLALSAFAVLQLSLAHRLPERLATHADPQGEVDGFSSVPAFFWSAFAVGSVLGALGVFAVIATRRSPSTQRVFTGIAVGVSTNFIALQSIFLLRQVDVTDPSTVDFAWWSFVIPFVAGLLGGTAGYLLAGRTVAPAAEPLPSDAPRIPLAAEERASWSQTVVTRMPVVVSVLVLALGIFVTYAVGWPGILVLLSALTLMCSASVRVTVDSNGLAVRPTFPGWPRKRIGLDRIAHASVRETEPVRKFGGWGYRYWGRTTAVVLRAGEAISLELTDGSEFLVTVDDAATGSALVNSLAERARATG
ncbi:SdpI family protein [Allokutzneria albata]|uniref:DUF1648 domain-containing protein n=1 Tax=Allokutzneria albata TaxID=211114 RepID=A0A1G9WBM1_ALLAB|nr:DUF1648 domain-containing protein [Allokutzneria albata]SDM81870.1 hypothetical protein SAMN04489726_3511 [Allokutzneria albata]